MKKNEIVVVVIGRETGSFKLDLDSCSDPDATVIVIQDFNGFRRIMAGAQFNSFDEIVLPKPHNDGAGVDAVIDWIREAKAIREIDGTLSTGISVVLAGTPNKKQDLINCLNQLQDLQLIDMTDEKKQDDKRESKENNLLLYKLCNATFATSLAGLVYEILHILL